MATVNCLGAMLWKMKVTPFYWLFGIVFLAKFNSYHFNHSRWCYCTNHYVLQKSDIMCSGSESKCTWKETSMFLGTWAKWKCLINFGWKNNQFYYNRSCPSFSLISISITISLLFSFISLTYIFIVIFPILLYILELFWETFSRSFSRYFMKIQQKA